MHAVESKSFNAPDEQRTPPSTTIDVVNVGGHAVARFTFQPGWRWTEHIAPVMGTDTCQATHLGAVVSGRMHILGADGTDVVLTPGDAYTIAPGHDAWTVGDEPCVVVEFQSAATFGKPS
jgi:quercetin dioxygenase-like cupin family protein